MIVILRKTYVIPFEAIIDGSFTISFLFTFVIEKRKPFIFSCVKVDVVLSDFIPFTIMLL